MTPGNAPEGMEEMEMVPGKPEAKPGMEVKAEDVEAALKAALEGAKNQ